jgi:hypothetical protein
MASNVFFTVDQGSDGALVTIIATFQLVGRGTLGLQRRILETK